MDLHDLGTVNEALPAVRNQVWLSLTPAAQGGSPLPGPPEVEQLMADTDHRAIGQPGGQRRHLAGRYADHDLIQQPATLSRTAQRDHGLAQAQPPKTHQITVSEPLTDRRRLSKPPARRQRVPAVNSPHRTRQEQEAAFRAIGVTTLKKPASPCQPAGRLSHLIRVHQLEDKPERAPRRPIRLAPILQDAERPSPRSYALAVPADEVARHREPLEILRTQRRLPIGRR